MMKRVNCGQHFRALALFTVLAIFGAMYPMCLAAEDQALIVPVAEGMRIIRVEAWDGESLDWKVVAQAYLKGDEGTVKLRIPEGLNLTELKVTASYDTLIPESYLQSAKTVKWDGEADTVGGMWASVMTDSAGGEREVTDASVEESDIWKLDGDVVYFFNSRRGLQIFDVSDVSNPKIMGSLSYMGRGEQMYLHEGTHAILLSNNGNTGVEIISVEDQSAPEIIASIGDLPGYYVESRKVGDRLFVVTNEWRYDETTEGNVWRNRATLTTIDLSEPANPLIVGSLAIQMDRGYGFAVNATAEVFMLSVNNYVYEESESDWWARGWHVKSDVTLIDISGDGEPSILGKAVTTGRIHNKFRMQYADGILTTIGEAQGREKGTGVRYRNTVLETFAVGAAEVTALGVVELAKNENLRASRFDGDRAYVVTFEQIDPLFVIDLSDPSNPSVLGELEVPGFSTYLEVLENGQLLSVGVEDRRVAVSLFDVEDPEQMALIDRVYIGDEGSYSWSEGNYEDKAISVLESEGFVLLPYYSYEISDGVYTQSKGIQVFGLSEEGLDVHGQVLHESLARRATSLGGGNLISISGTQLITFDLSDLDVPEILADLTISWNVDSVFKTGDYLVQLDRLSRYDSSSNSPMVRISSVGDPDVLIGEMELPNGAIVGEEFKEEILYLLYRNQTYDEVLKQYVGVELELVQVDFSNPETPRMSGAVDVPVEDDGFRWGSMDAHWMNAQTLVWTSAGVGVYPIYAYSDVMISSRMYWWPYYGDNGMSVLAVDVSDSELPKVLDYKRYDAEEKENGWGRTGDVYFVDDNGYFISEYSWYVRTETPGENGEVKVDYMYHTDHEVVEIDLSDLTGISFGNELEINGDLIGIESNGLGTLLFTSEERSRWIEGDDGNAGTHERNYWMRAYLHDGVQLLQVDAYDWKVADGSYPTTSLMAFSDRKAYRPLTLNGEEASVVIERLDFKVGGRFEIGEEYSMGGSWISELQVDDYLLAFSGEEGRYWPELNEAARSQLLSAPSQLNYYYGANSDSLVIKDEGIWKANGVYGISSWELESSLLGVWADQSAEHQELVWWEPIDGNKLKLSEIELSDEVGRLGELQWRFRSSGFKNPDEEAVDVGEGWFESSWFGWYQGGEKGAWIWHVDHGWNFAQGDGNGTYEYDRELGWYYTGSSLYPYVYTYSPAGWMYYQKETGPTGTRWFYDYRGGKNEWMSVPRSGM